MFNPIFLPFWRYDNLSPVNQLTWVTLVIDCLALFTVGSCSIYHLMGGTLPLL